MLDALFFPRSVAVIGASRKELSIGNRIIRNLQEFGYTGPIYAVNPKGDEVRGLAPHASIAEVPGEVDLVHIVIPAHYVGNALRDCGEKGVRVAIINSAGFKEVGAEGQALEEEVLAIAGEYGLRVFGPNCQGIINTDPGVRAYCNFTFTRPHEGHISIVAQSGGVGEVLNQRFAELGVGIRMYASNGNASDVSIPEIIRFWGEDEPTRVIVVHIESLADPVAFMEAAREVAAEKPILAMKAGRTAEGAKAVASHTGGLAGQEIALELLFRKTGVVAFRDEEEMCQAAVAFASQPVPAGNRVGLITNTGGPAIIATDELVEAGLVIPPLSESARQELTPKLHEAAAISNPIDVLATAGADHFRAAADTLLNEEGIDSIYINFVTPFFVDNEAVARELVEVNRDGRKPIVCNLMTDKREWAGTIQTLREGGIPCYSFPEMAARALAAMNRYRLLRSRPMEEPERYRDVDPDLAREVLEEGRREGGAWLSAAAAWRLLEACGIAVAPWRVVGSADEAVAAAAEIGFPVAVKADSPAVLHKTEAAGVALALEDAGEVASAVEAMRSALPPEGLRFLVQEYVSGGTELIAGVKAEEGLGHLIMVGLGGIQTELLKDVAFSLAPITGHEATEMVTTLRSFPLLEGFRGKPGTDLPALIEILQRLSQLVTDLPGITELDLNPIIARPDLVCVVDVRVGI